MFLRQSLQSVVADWCTKKVVPAGMLRLVVFPKALHRLWLPVQRPGVTGLWEQGVQVDSHASGINASGTTGSGASRKSCPADQLPGLLYDDLQQFVQSLKKTVNRAIDVCDCCSRCDGYFLTHCLIRPASGDRSENGQRLLHDDGSHDRGVIKAFLLSYP